MTYDGLNRLFAELTSFEPAAPRPRAGDADWGEVATLALEQGIAPILSYQLEYRWPGLGAPEAVREQLLAVYQGTVGDLVFKLVRLKELLSAEGMPDALLLGGAATADVFFPHVAFRPIPELEILVRPAEREAAAQALARAELAPGRPEPGATPFSDGRIVLWLRTALPGLAQTATELEALFARRVRARAYGPRAHRLAPEDALLAAVAALADEGLVAPRIAFVELREMALRGGQGAEGFWDPDAPPLDPARLFERARGEGLRRALFAALELVARLHPTAAEAARRLAPELPARSRALLRRLVVLPSQDPRRLRLVRGERALRRAMLR